MVQSLWQVIIIIPEKPNMRLKQIISLVVFCLLVPLSCISGQDPCPDGYGFSFQNSCYKFVSLTDSRNNAARKCALEEAHLADIKSAEEQQFLVNWLQGIDADATWIGLSRQKTDEYVWTDGSPLEYDAWAPDEPNNNNECVRLKRNSYQWNDVPCDRVRPYICEIEAIGCPSDWHFHNDFCYFVGKEMSTYEDARLACIEKNASLSSVNNQNEQYVHNRFAIFYDNLWIGLNDRANESIWQWEDESTYNFTNWALGEPNDSGGTEECAHLSKSRSGEWSDVNCNSNYGYICKMPSEPTTTVPTAAAMTTSSLTSPVDGPTPVATIVLTSRSTITIPANRTDVGGTPNPRSGVSPGAIAGAVIGSVLLLVLILFLIASRPRKHRASKKYNVDKNSGTIPTTINGPEPTDYTSLQITVSNDSTSNYTSLIKSEPLNTNPNINRKNLNCDPVNQDPIPDRIPEYVNEAFIHDGVNDDLPKTHGRDSDCNYAYATVNPPDNKLTAQTLSPDVNKDVADKEMESDIVNTYMDPSENKTFDKAVDKGMESDIENTYMDPDVNAPMYNIESHSFEVQPVQDRHSYINTPQRNVYINDTVLLRK